MKTALLCVALQLIGALTVSNAQLRIFAEKDYAVASEDFYFSCFTIYPNTLSALAVLINGNATADWDRLKSVDFSDTRVDFRFIGVSSSEDGTTFQCRNNENGQLSDILKLNVYYINFTETATPNISIWSEFNVHQPFSLKCSTISKPLLVAIQGSLSTKYGGNVIFKPKADMQGGEFTVTEAQLSNTGNYTCMATNGIVFRNMTYSTFIGGPPLDTSVSEISVTVGKEIEIKFKITDNSPAPARGVMIAAKHLESGNVSFDRPIMGGPMEASYKLMKGLNEIAPDYYNFSITPYNTLGSGTAVSLKQFINGLNYTVEMTTSDSDVALFTNFTINCIASSQYVNLTLLVNGQPSEGDHRVSELFNKNGSARFVFKPTSPSHNGSVFMCTGTAGTEQKNSSRVAVNVLYAPVFMSSANTTVWDEYAIASNYSLNCSLKYSGNPPSKLHYTTNDKKSEANVNIISSSSAVVYNVTKATAKNRDNFTCFAENKMGWNFITQLAYVGGPPSSVVTVNIRVDDKEFVVLDMNISDHSDAPATEFFLNIEDIHYNKTFKITGLPQTEYQYPNLLNMKSTLFGNSGHRVVVTAKNKIGEAVVYNKTKNVPAVQSSTQLPTSTPTSSHATLTPSHKPVTTMTTATATTTMKTATTKTTMKTTSTTTSVPPKHSMRPSSSGTPLPAPQSNAVAIIVSAVVVIGLLVLIAVGGAVGYFVYTKRQSAESGYQSLNNEDDETERTGTSYGSTS